MNEQNCWEVVINEFLYETYCWKEGERNSKIFFTIPANASALANSIEKYNPGASSELNQSADKKYQLKMKMAKELEQNGTIDMLTQKRQQYYEENRDILIDFSKITDLNSKEAKEAIKIIEKDMSNHQSMSKGSNNISYSAFGDGDIILVHDGSCPWGYYRHGGTYDEDLGQFISAQVGDGVLYESKS